MEMRGRGSGRAGEKRLGRLSGGGGNRREWQMRGSEPEWKGVEGSVEDGRVEGMEGERRKVEGK